MVNAFGLAGLHGCCTANVIGSRHMLHCNINRVLYLDMLQRTSKSFTERRAGAGADRRCVARGHALGLHLRGETRPPGRASHRSSEDCLHPKDLLGGQSSLPLHPLSKQTSPQHTQVMTVGLSRPVSAGRSDSSSAVAMMPASTSCASRSKSAGSSR